MSRDSPPNAFLLRRIVEARSVGDDLASTSFNTAPALEMLSCSGFGISESVSDERCLSTLRSARQVRFAAD